MVGQSKSNLKPYKTGIKISLPLDIRRGDSGIFIFGFIRSMSFRYHSSQLRSRLSLISLGREVVLIHSCLST